MKKITITLGLLVTFINATTQSIDNDTTLAKKYYKKAGKYRNNWEIDSSIYYFEKSMNLFKQSDEKIKYFKASFWYSESLFRSHRLEEALNHICKIHDENLQFCDSISINYFSLIASLYSGLGNNKKAIEYYNLATEWLKKNEGADSYIYNIHFQNIGIHYANIGEYDLSIEYYNRSIDFFKSKYGDNNKNLGLPYYNISEAYLAKEDLTNALKYVEKSYKIRMQNYGESHPSIGSCYMIMGRIHAAKNNFEEALKYYTKGLKNRINHYGHDYYRVANAYLEIGKLHLDFEKTKKSKVALNKAYNIYKSKNKTKIPITSEILYNIGKAHEKEDNYDSAMYYYNKTFDNSLISESLNLESIDILNSPTTHFQYIEWEYLIKALMSEAYIYSTFPSVYYKKKAFRNYLISERILAQTKQYSSTKSDKLNFGGKANEIYKEIVNSCLELLTLCEDSSGYYKNLAFQFSEKNKSSVLLESLAGVEAMKFSGIPDSILEKEQDLKINIALYKKILAEQPDSAKEIRFRDKLFNANRSYDSLMQVFEKKYPKYHELKYGQRLATVEQLQRILDKESAMISYMEGDSTFTIFKIEQKDFSVQQVPKIKNYDDLTLLLRANITYPQKDNAVYLKTAHKLFKQLFPFELDENIKNLIIIPDGGMSLIPFEVLLTEKFDSDQEYYAGFPFLINKYNISYSYSANLIYRTFPKEKTKKIEVTPLNDWLAIAPVFDDGKTGGATLRTRELLRDMEIASADSTRTRGTMLSGEYITPLPGTEKEVKNIFNKFESNKKKAVVQLKETANEEYIKSGALKDYKYIHFASHGMVNTEKPELSGVILAQDSTSNEDGILHTGEIYNLELNADLTVLSACETGLGEIKKGEGLIGLSRALLYAGSKNIIVSLWKVADNSTSQLMVDFYDNLLKEENTQNYSEALRKAKLKMIAEGKYAHPFYWSPFILIGK